MSRKGRVRWLSPREGVCGVAMAGKCAEQLPVAGYVQVDAAAAYHRQVSGLRLITRLNLINLFDQQYFESSNTTDFLTPIPRLGIILGPPLTVIESIQTRTSRVRTLRFSDAGAP